MKKRPKIIPINEAEKAGEVLKQFGASQEEEAPSVPGPPGDIPFLVRARFSPWTPGLAILIGALFMITGFVDSLHLVWLPGSALLLAGLVWLFRQRMLFQFAYRSGGSSPQSGKKPGPHDEYNDSIVTRG